LNSKIDRIMRQSRKREQSNKIKDSEMILLPKESEVLKYIVQETLFQRRRCAILSFGDISNQTGIHRGTVGFQLEQLEKRNLLKLILIEVIISYC